jgi:hypothetical protein
MELFKFNIHSMVDVITNSSTVIYTYEDGCELPAKELINEMLKLSGETDKTCDDIFYIGTFCDSSRYFDCAANGDDEDDEDEDDEDDEDDDEQETTPKIPSMPKIVGSWNTPEYKESHKIRDKWFSDLQISIMKGEVEKPRWMEDAEEASDYSEWRPTTELLLIARDEKYAEFGRKISRLLSGISADGGRDG